MLLSIWYVITCLNAINSKRAGKKKERLLKSEESIIMSTRVYTCSAFSIYHLKINIFE